VILPQPCAQRPSDSVLACVGSWRSRCVGGLVSETPVPNERAEPTSLRRTTAEAAKVRKTETRARGARSCAHAELQDVLRDMNTITCPCRRSALAVNTISLAAGQLQAANQNEVAGAGSTRLSPASRA